MITSFSESFLPERPFIDENRATINSIFQQLENDFPDINASRAILKEGEMPSIEQMNWMWTRLMGRQHGSTEGLESKLNLSSVDQLTYRKLIDKLHYGKYSFTSTHSVDPNLEYTNSLILGGTPQEISSRLQAGIGDGLKTGNVSNTIVLAGQRLRWRSTPGERSVFDIYNAVGQMLDVDIEELRMKSPWIREEEKKITNRSDKWSGPYATETEIGRLCIEAFFRDFIDWNNYNVSIFSDNTATEHPYLFRGDTHIIPPRTDAVITYELTNGTKAHLLNAVAVPRTQGVPRPTSDSQAKELVTTGMVGNVPEKLNVAVSAPHIRAGIDIFTRFLNEGVSISHAEIVNGPWEAEKELITALGEIPATHKADLRLRAVINGEDPDRPTLATL